MCPGIVRVSWVLVATLTLAGCTRGPATTDGTGAKGAAQEFFAAVLKEDSGHTAYTLLAADSQARCPETQFLDLARAYRRDLGFVPEETHVRSCEEHDDEAIAHVVAIGSNATGQKFYRDTITLRKEDSAWRVVLSANFGHSWKR
jgi:hypothetical protein